LFEESDDEMLFMISGKFVEQLRWLARKRKQFNRRDDEPIEDDIPSYGK